MLAARQLEIVGNCHERSERPRKRRPHLSDVVNRLAALAIPAYFPKGTILFFEGQPSRGVLFSPGQVKLYTSSAGGRTLF
jgi:hypothetical protein